MEVADRVFGVLSVYVEAACPVDLCLLERAETLAVQGAVMLDKAAVSRDLHAAVATRQQIGQACGILMSRFS